MNILRQMTIADEVMEKLAPITPHAIIAGGAPRDWYFQKTARDVDIFLYRPDLKTNLDVLSTFSKVGLSLSSFDTSLTVDGDHVTGHGTYIHNPNIDHVYETEYFGVQFQFIFMKSPTFTSVVPRFPLNLSRIWYKNGTIHPTGEFLHGVKNTALIKMDELYADGNKYIKKIRERFPDYKYYASVELYFQLEYSMLVQEYYKNG